MKPPRYVFVSEWRVGADPMATFAVLREIGDYPAWWPEIKMVERVDDDRARVLVRSFLPYDLRFDLIRTVDDPQRGVLETRLEGDLEGFSRWTIEPTEDGCLCRFDEDVVTNRRLLNVLAPVARPAFRANHWRMMRDGERGLRSYLSRRAAHATG